MTIRYFRWDDVGAPQLGAASSLSVVLEKCLVDGYGKQAGLGWGKIKSPSGKIVAFQPPVRAASRPWMAFDDRCEDEFQGSAALRFYNGLESFTDGGISNESAIASPSYAFVDKSMLFYPYRNASSVAGLPWFLVSDSEKDYFYFLRGCYLPGSTGYAITVFGSLGGWDGGFVASGMTANNDEYWQMYRRGSASGLRPGFAFENITIDMGGEQKETLRLVNSYSAFFASDPPKSGRLAGVSTYCRSAKPSLPGVISDVVLVANPVVVHSAGKVAGVLDGLYIPISDFNLTGMLSGGVYSPPDGSGKSYLAVLARTTISANNGGDPSVNGVYWVLLDLTGGW